MPEALMREVFIEGPDIQFRAGWETGRASEPAFMDMNLHALRRSAPPKVVLYQYDATNELNPHGLLIAYAEEYERHQKKIRSVKPVVSDFDTFTIGSIGMTYEPLPESQADLMLWSLEQARGILSKPGQQSWNSRWLEVLQKANREGFHPTIPQYGFGDPTSYRLVEEVVKATSISGAVRHGAECFKLLLPARIWFWVPCRLDMDFRTNPGPTTTWQPCKPFLRTGSVRGSAFQSIQFGQFVTQAGMRFFQRCKAGRMHKIA